MIRQSSLFIILCAAGVFLGFPVEVHCAARSPWSYFDRTAGLAENTVQAIAPDGAGGLWIGTRGGLTRYDGSRWKTITRADGLPDNDVHSLFVESPERLWVGAGSGFGRIEKGRWGRLGLPGAPGRVVVVTDRRGSTWFGHGGGLMRYDSVGGSLEPVPEFEGRPVRALLADREDRLWAGTDEGLLRLEDGSWREERAPQGLQAGPVGALLEDRDGTVWCGGRGISSFDGAVWRRSRLGEGAPEAQVTGLAVDGEGRLWAGTGAGVGYTDGETWHWFDSRSGLPSNEVLALAADPAGNIWIGTHRGLARYDASWLPVLPDEWEEGEEPRAPVLLRRDGASLVLADVRGFLIARGRSVERIGPQERLDATVRCFAEDSDGSLWVGTDRGLYRYDDGIREEHQPEVRRETVERGGGIIEARTIVVCDRYRGLTGEVVRALEPDEDGGLWVGTDSGLSRLQDGSWTCLEGPEELTSGAVSALAASAGGRLWAGTPRGLWELSGGIWTRHGRAEGLPSDTVLSLLVDRAGVLWVGTDRGAARRDGETWTVLDTRAGLVSNRVLTIAEGERGRIWFGTEEGVSFLEAGLWGAFGAQDGLPAPRVPSITTGAAGRVWFATEDGVAAHRPDRAGPETWIKNPPATQVGTPFALFEYAGGDLETPPARLRYSWRVDGGPWSGWSKESLVTVTDLANGTHRFEVRSLDAELNADTTPAAAEFEVNTKLFDLELVEASFGPLYASLYQFYASDAGYESRPGGRVVIRSRYDRPLRVKLSAFLPELMDFPSDAVVTVPPGQTVTVPMRIELSERALELERTESRQLRLAIQYYIGGDRKEAESTHAATVVEKHGMTWEDPARIALYVTHLDEAIERYAREVVRGFREEERRAIVYDNLLRAMELFDALGVSGVRYVPDPANPYGGIVAGRPTLDVVRLPRETLRLLTGDCDDLAVLYAALLQNIGIDTALVDVYDHVFVMFDTGLTARSARQLAHESLLLHVDDQGRVWVPVETTLLGQSFTSAWESAASTLASRQHAIIETGVSWKTYAPLRPREPAPEIVPPSLAAVRPRFLEDVRRQEEALTSPRMRTLAQRIAADPRDAAAINALGVLLAQRGYLGRAAENFQSVIALLPDFAGGYSNLANVLYEQGNFPEAIRRYEESLALAELPEVHVELALALCEIGRFDLARQHYRRAMNIDPSLAAASGAQSPAESDKSVR